MTISIRFAVSDDVPLILNLIRGLADYERLSHEVTATPDQLQTTLFGPAACAEVLIGELDGTARGFALFFPNYSTFLAKPGIHLEDLFVQPEFRGRGLGKALLTRLASLACERGCGRLEWNVLDWNEPAIRFYKSFGARVLADWNVCRLTGERLQAYAPGA